MTIRDTVDVSEDQPAEQDILRGILSDQLSSVDLRNSVGGELGYGPDVLPAIALTAFARNEDRNAALAAGFQDHMVKPLDPQTLVLRVASLQRHRAARG